MSDEIETTNETPEMPSVYEQLRTAQETNARLQHELLAERYRREGVEAALQRLALTIGELMSPRNA